MSKNQKQDDVFPRALLTLPIEDRYQYFEEYSVAHFSIFNAFQTLKHTIECPAGKQLIFVMGPTRAGKSFLLDWIKDYLETEWLKRQHTDPGRIPVVAVEIPSKDTVKPSSSDIYTRVLEALEEPLLEKKTIYGDVAVFRSGDGKVVVEPTTTKRLRRAFEKALQNRQPKLLFDEGQHLLDMAGLTIEDIMDWVKSVANMTGVLIIIFGTYNMLDFVGLSDQLMCRSKIIHLYRYNDSDEHVALFNSTVRAFEKNMPLEKASNLLQHADFLKERTAGCVGNLYLWLLAAYDLALKNNAKRLTVRHLQATVPLSAVRAAKIIAHNTRDEKRFEEEIGDEEVDFSEFAGSQKARKKAAERAEGENKSRSRRKHGPVGERKPERDKTGLHNKAA